MPERRGRDEAPQAPASEPREGVGKKTVVVTVQEAPQGLGSAQAAGDDLARFSLPAGWEVTLDVIAGPDQGKSYQITRSRVLIGRDGTEVLLTDEFISRRHASIEVYAATCVLLKDLGSSNGTVVNGYRVGAAELRDGDVIEIGTTKLVVGLVTPPG